MNASGAKPCRLQPRSHAAALPVVFDEPARVGVHGVEHQVSEANAGRRESGAGRVAARPVGRAVEAMKEGVRLRLARATVRRCGSAFVKPSQVARSSRPWKPVPELSGR